jgi:DNA invertase Pin-like site-specific DNA recombinase
MVIGYIRVSTGKQDPENQKEEISRYTADNNCAVDKWVTEVVSGKKELKEI